MLPDFEFERAGDTVLAYADGSALGSSKKGGWAAFLRFENDWVILKGNSSEATNNTMELTAVIHALEAIPFDAIGVVRTDSDYVVKGVNEWSKTWIKNGWHTANRKPVLNKDLWVALLALRDAHPNIRFAWVKGHGSNIGNQLVDMLAQDAARKQAPITMQRGVIPQSDEAA